MSFDRYYREELSYLRELGAEFADRNASLAPFLARESFDPDVERLIEGFAFLTGRLRQKLDDELPELTQSLAQIVAPYLLTPIPAMTVVQFFPSRTGGRARMTVARGSEIASRPIRGGRCRFRTCYDVKLTPVRVVDASAVTLVRHDRIRLELVLTDRAEFAELALDRLRLYLDPGGDGALARSLYMALRTQCRGLRVEDGSGRGYDLPPDVVRPVGFRPDEAVVPWPDKAAPGWRLLQEFFVFPDKFMFLDIHGLEETTRFSGGRLVVTFDLDEPFADASGLTADSIRVNTTPVVNLFDADADPIRVDDRRGEYRLTARDSAGNRHEIHSVRRVRGHDRNAAVARGRVEYAPLESFGVLGGARDRACYSVRRHTNPATNAIDATIAFSRTHGVRSKSRRETVSCAVRCTNGTLPAEIPTGHVDQMTDGSPNFAAFRDIQPITRALPPPLEQSLMRRSIAGIAANFSSMLDVDALRAVMAACNTKIHFDHAERRRHVRLAEGLEDIDAAPFDWFVEGLPMRGWDITVTVVESKFGGLGDVCLFAGILGEFFDDLAGINTVHRLELVARESNRRFREPVRIGRAAVL